MKRLRKAISERTGLPYEETLVEISREKEPEGR
jgi:hypothetical protein